MDLLGAAKIVELREQISDSLALPRHSSRRETRCGVDWFTIVRNRAWPFLAIAACCAINSPHYQPTVTRAQKRLTVARPLAAAGDGSPVQPPRPHLPHLGPSTRPARRAVPEPVCVRGVQTEVELV
jgi:hypothetical protein